MRLNCPVCGERDHSEFVYRGDATKVRPDPAAADAAAAFHDYVHIRTNPAGWHFEHWYHEGGCRSWIVVERNTLTHAMKRSFTAREFVALRDSVKPGGKGEKAAAAADSSGSGASA